MSLGKGGRWFEPGEPLDVAREEFALMQRYKAAGRKIVIGSDEAYPVGEPMIRVEAGEARIKRRATKQEFIESISDNLEFLEAGITARFYYELELVEVCH